MGIPRHTPAGIRACWVAGGRPGFSWLGAARLGFWRVYHAVGVCLVVGPDFLGRHLCRVHGVSHPWADRGGRPHDSRADGTQVLTTQIALQALWVSSGTLSSADQRHVAGKYCRLALVFRKCWLC